MKDYEVYSSLKVPKNSKVIVRLDGRAFHKLASDLKLVKPYDRNFYQVMAVVCEDLFREFSPSFVYTFSDEISLLLNNIPFDGRIEKINSVMAGFASSSFVIHYDVDFKKPPAFDSRIIPINDEDILDYLTKYSNNEANDKINGMKLNEIHELLFQNGINLNDIETYKKRGIGIYRKNKKVVGFNKKENKNQTSYRSYVFTDWELPIFNENFFKKIGVIE